MFLVPLATPGVEVQPVHTLGGERTNITFYTDVRVPDAACVGAVDDGWNVMTITLVYERGTVDSRGQNVRVLRHGVDWATANRRGGHRVIDSAAVRERFARIAIENEVTKLLGYRTTWVAATGGLPGVEGSMRKLWESESFLRAASSVLDVLGPAGVLSHGEQDAPAHGWVEHAHRHAAVTTIYGGSSEFQRKIITERHLHLPRSAGAAERARAD